MGKRHQRSCARGRIASRALAALEALTVLAAFSACSHDEIVTPPDPTPPAAVAPPTDRLAKNELLEGNEKAFGLTLPRDFHIDHAFPDVVYAKGPGRAEAVTEYFRARVVHGVVRADKAGGAGTVFEQVQTPSSPGRDVSIRIIAGTDLRSCELEVRDVTPPTDIPPTEAERWRAAGLDPDGRILDPTHLK